jgi:hypothetical protein
MWCGRPARAKELRHFALSVEAGKTWKQVCVTSLEGWLCQPTEVAAPVSAERLSGAPVGIALTVPKVKPASLLVASAREAFRGITMEFLKKLYAHLELKERGKPLPKLDIDLARALVEYALPELSAAEVETIVSKRYASKEAKFKAFISSQNVEAAMGVIDEDDLKDAMREVRKVEEEQKKASVKKPAGSGVAARPPGKGKASATKKPIMGESWTMEEAKLYLPKIAGCSAALDLTRHFRWVVKYPRQEPPYSTSRAFQKEGSQRAAFLFCVAWAWNEHEAATGEPCPWIFD